MLKLLRAIVLPLPCFAATDGTNNVWDMIGATASGAANIYRDISIAKINAQTKSAPAGTPNNSAANPPPGTLGQFPQSQTKPTPGGIVSSTSMWQIAGLIVAAILGFVLLARR